MKKRMLSIVLSVLMVLSSFTVAFSATDYDGIKPLQTEEKVLDQLNVDAAAAIFDKAQHQTQLSALTEVYAAFDTNANVAGAWDEYIEAVFTNHKTEDIEAYLQWLQLAYEESAPMTETAKNRLEALDAAYDTTGLDLSGSADKLDAYQAAGAVEISYFKQNGYFSALQDTTVEKYIRMASEPVFRMILSTIGAGNDPTALENNYKEWMEQDRAKKILSVLYGEELTRELAADSADEGVVGQLKGYMRTAEGLGYINSQLATVFASDEEDFVSAVYKFIGNVLYKAYEGDPLQADVKMLFGVNEEKGAFECGMGAVDPEGKAANVLINLFLSEYVQTQIKGETLTTISAETALVAGPEIEDNSTIKFIPENIFEEYGITNENVKRNLSYRTNWFELICYVEDSQNPGTYIDNSEYVVCNGASFDVVKKDETKGDTYPAYLVLYRQNASNVIDTFIESYPITVKNKVKNVPSGGGGTSMYTLFYETNGGNIIDPERYAKGTTVEITKKPVKDGYNFAGWYIDKELTKRVDAVVMSNNVTVYAAWTEITGVDVPGMLNGDDHFAYVVGYPDGTVRPFNNITRAEAATIIFRLLKDEVRDSNLTSENNFADSNEGNWFNAAVSTLAKLGIVNGRTADKFEPNEYITRAEFAAIFARFAEFDVSASELSFTDISTHWAKEEIEEAAAYGWIKGYEDDSFRPDQCITRAETMTLINRVLRRLPETKDDLLAEAILWPDNSNVNAWFYLAVQEATNSHEYEKKNNVNEKWVKIIPVRDWTKFEK